MKKNFVKYEYYTNSNGKNNHYIFDENYSDEDINHDEFFNSQVPQSTKNNPNCNDKLKQLFEKMIKKENLKKKETKEELKYHSDDSYSYSSDDIDIDNIFKNKKQDDKGKNNVYQKEKIKIKVEEKVEEEEEESDDELDKILNKKIDFDEYFSDIESEEKEDTPKNYQLRTIKSSLLNLYSDKGIDNKNNIKENIENKKDDKNENIQKSNLNNCKLEDKKSDIKKSNSSNINKNLDIEDNIFKEKISLLKNIKKPKNEIEKLIEKNQKEKEEDIDKEKEEEEEFEEDEEQYFNEKQIDKPPSKFIRVDTDDDNLEEEEYEEEIEEIYEDDKPTKDKKIDLLMNLFGMLYSKKKR